MATDLSTERAVDRFAFGLTTADVVELQSILREDCDEDLPLEEAWSRAAGLLSLTQALLDYDSQASVGSDAAELELRPT